MDDEPIQQQYRAKMNGIAQVLDNAFNGPDGGPIIFTLLIAETGKIDGGRVNYISNGNREDIICMLKEWLARAEGRIQLTETEQ